MGEDLPLRPRLTERVRALLTRKRSLNTDEAMHRSTLARGHEAETLAANYLSERGMKILDRNVRAGRGEIDLVMQEGETVVFVEVRARKSTATVSAVESISRSKRLKVIETAERLLIARVEWCHRPCRFDVVAVSTFPNAGPVHIDWIKDAFQPGQS